MNRKRLGSFLKKLGYGPAPESETYVRVWLDAHSHKFDHFIAGAWQQPYHGRYFPTINPANGEVLAEVAYAAIEDVDAAVQAAECAFPLWNGLSGHERAKYLYAIARAIAKNSRPFAVLESLDNGKTIRETRDIDIPLVIRHFYYYAGWAQIAEKEYPNFKPQGVIAQIIPWNFPLLMLAWKIAPAIAVGNTVVLKPAEFTPLTALMFAEMLMEEVKLPLGVVNIVTGDGATGEALVRHPVPKGIKFTGSTEVGRLIRKATAGSGKHLTLELGGKSPFIVFANADLDSAVEGVVNAIWFNQGQVCCAGSRLLVEESIYEEFIRRLKIRMTKLRGGKPLDKAMDIGAINSSAQLSKIQRLVEQGQKEGACLWQPPNWLCPSEASGEGGYYFPPTIFTNVQPSHTIAQEEIFGPVLVCMSFRTPQEALQLANNTRYGLAASAWSQDIDLAFHSARKIKAGTIWLNSTNLFDAASGFGGYRESGFGREGGREGIFEVMEEQPIPDPDPIDLTPMQESPVHSSLNTEIDQTFRFLIGGKLARPDGATSIKVKSPSGEILGLVGNANRKDVRNAVETARKSTDAWEDQSPHLRAQILYFLAENLSVHTERFAEGIARQTFRSLESARKEVSKSIESLFTYAALSDKFEGTIQPVVGRYLVTAIKEPIGIIGIRAPDEYPLLGLVSTLAPALAMGNTVVLVSGRYALTAMDFVRVLQDSDIPVGVVNILSAGSPDAIAKILAEHEDVDSVWFFGSAEGVKEAESASVSNMKRTFTSEKFLFSTHRFLCEATQIKNIWIPYGV